MSFTKWNIPAGNTVIPDALLRQGYSPLLAAMLHVRGYDDPGEARAFLDSSETLLGDPLMMTDMPEAVRRLQRAIDTRETGAVYGDYDVDGITSTCMLTDYLRGKGLSCELYIPDRLEEGYGVNCDAITALRDKGVTLIITVDCGVTTAEEAKFASEIGVDMIITDHHECRKAADSDDVELPEAIAVVDPKRPDCNYPSRDLAGVGVAFKLLCALEGSAEPVLDRYADLVAVGTIADVMPLIGENRYIVKKGLEKLEHNPLPGLRALIEEAGLGEKKVTATNIGFTLAPRLNASGRLGQVETAIHLLLTDSPRKASGYAADLCQLNRERQATETEIWREAREMLGDEKPDTPIVLARENWHQGVIGIAASRLTEAYGVPAIMICLDEDKGKGSCRSCGGFNLFEALNECSEYLEGFGGHALAAGLTIKKENIDAFRAAIGAYYRSHPTENVSTLKIDLCVDSPALLTMECVEDLEKLEPCGTGNPRPQLALLGARLTDLIPIGAGKHLRLKLEKSGETYEAVYFSHDAQSLGARVGDWVDAAFYPQINEFRGRRSVQLLISDLRPHDCGYAEELLQGAVFGGCAAFAPTREDCGVLWRNLQAAGGEISAPLPALSAALCPQMREEKFCICLKVLEDLGLLSLGTDGSTFSVKIVPGAAGAAFDTSAYLARVRSAV